jgi:hypothetical protein
VSVETQPAGWIWIVDHACARTGASLAGPAQP